MNCIEIFQSFTLDGFVTNIIPFLSENLSFFDQGRRKFHWISFEYNLMLALTTTFGQIIYKIFLNNLIWKHKGWAAMLKAVK